MKEKLSMILFVLVLGSMLTVALVVAHDYTAPIIERNQALKIKTKVLEAFDIAHTKDDVETVFSRNIETTEKEDRMFYISRNREIAFEISGSGLWGPIHGVIAMMPDLETIKGITIIHQEETPGLGGRIAEKAYLDKFKNKKIFPELKILPPGKVRKENEVDAITGATLSCKAFEKILNSQLKEYLSLFRSVHSGS